MIRGGSNTPRIEQRINGGRGFSIRVLVA